LTPLSDLLERLKGVVASLESIAGSWPEALRAELPSLPQPEATRLEELLDLASHETAGTLAFVLHDIEGLLERARLRAKFDLFTSEQIDRIVSQGGSLALLQDLHSEIPSLTLPELSARVQELAEAWGRLPRVHEKRSGSGSGSASTRTTNPK